MNKLSFFEIKKLLISCGLGYNYNTIVESSYVGFHHKHKWDHGYETYYGYNGSRREFYHDLSMVINCLQEYISRCNLNYTIVSPVFNEKPFAYRYKNDDKNYDIIAEIEEFLKFHNVSKQTKSGIIIDSNSMETISMIIEGAFRGVTKLCLFFPERSIIMVPNHHFGITILTPSPEREKAVLNDILMNYSELISYD